MNDLLKAFCKKHKFELESVCRHGCGVPHPALKYAIEGAYALVYYDCPKVEKTQEDKIKNNNHRCHIHVKPIDPKEKQEWEDMYWSLRSHLEA